MNFTIEKSIEILERTPAVLEAMLKNVSAEWTEKSEGGETWSAFDVLGHLVHGEKTDWIPRMEIILSLAPEKHSSRLTDLPNLKKVKAKRCRSFWMNSRNCVKRISAFFIPKK